MFAEEFLVREGNEPPFGTATNGPGKVTGCCGWSTAGQDEILEGRKIEIKRVEISLKMLNTLRINGRVLGQRQFTSEIEEFMLDASKNGANRLGHRVVQHDTQLTIDLIDGTDGFDTCAVFVDTLATGETGGSVIACACIDLGKSVTHGRIQSM